MHSDPSVPRASVQPVPVGDIIGDVLEWLRAVLGGDVPANDVEPPDVGLAAAARILGRARQLFEDLATRSACARGARYQSFSGRVRGVGAGRSKATVFAGDVLHLAGFVVPSLEVRGWDGSSVREYRDAGGWPRLGTAFDAVTDLWQVRPGDLLVGTAHGPEGHVEIVTDVAFVDGALMVMTMGARDEGLVEDLRWGDELVAARAEAGAFLRTSAAGEAPGRLHLLRVRLPQR